MFEVRNVLTILRKVARSGTPGPVFVELPIDTLYPSSMVEKEISNSGGKKAKPSLLQRATEIYLQRLLQLGGCRVCAVEICIAFVGNFRRVTFWKNELAPVGLFDLFISQL